MSLDVQPAGNDDLLDQIFGAEIHLPEVKGTAAKSITNEANKTADVTEVKHYEEVHEYDGEHEERITELREHIEETHEANGHHEFKEFDKVENHVKNNAKDHRADDHEVEKDEIEEHDKQTVKKVKQGVHDIDEESSTSSSDSETDVASEHIVQQPEVLDNEQSDSEKDEDDEFVASEAIKKKPKDKLAPLRSPIQDQLIAEMREKQGELENKDDDYEQIVEEDVPLGDDLDNPIFYSGNSHRSETNPDTSETHENYDLDGGLLNSKEDEHEMPKLEEKAESFLEYDRVKTAEVMEEKILEPSFDIDMKSEDYDHELEKFDERAGLESAASRMAEIEQSVKDEDIDKKQMRFSELPMDSENTEIHWEHTEEINNPMFYNDNIVMKRSEKYSMHKSAGDHENTDAGREEYQSSEAGSHVVYSTVAEDKGLNNYEHDEEAFSGPGVQSLRSLFENGNKKPVKMAGHPPQKVQEVYGYIEPVVPYRNAQVSQQPALQETASVADVEHHQPVVAKDEKHHVEEAEHKTFVPNVTHEEQKPVNELLNIFGGRKQPTPKNEISKTVLHKAIHSVIRVPAKRSRASSFASEKEKTPNPVEKAALPSLKPRMQSPIFTSKDQFQSVRVVKNVRQFVKIWGRAPYTPNSPHPMSPVSTDFDLDYVSQEKPHVLKPTPSRRSSVANLTNMFSGQHQIRTVDSTTAADDVEKRSETSNEPHHIVQSETKVESEPHIISAMDKIEDIQIDNVPVSERRKMFERNVAFSKPKDSQEDKRQYNGRQVAQVKAVVREEPVEEEILKSGKQQELTVDEIRNETEEMEDYITSLIPVSQRRKIFETGNPTNRNIALPGR